MTVAAIDVYPLGMAGQVVAGSAAGPTSYATGGFDPGFPNGTIIWCAVDVEGGFVTVVDYTNKLIKAFQSAAAGNPLTEVAATTNLSAQTFRFCALMRR